MNGNRTLFMVPGSQDEISCSSCCNPARLIYQQRRQPQREGTNLSYLAQELSELSVEEREKVYEDIHGVARRLEETPEKVESALKQLEVELSLVSRQKRKAYDRAVFLKPSLATDRKFKLGFLRADRHDPVAAARRLCDHFTNKLELFGEDKLAKRITLDDLDEDDMECLRTGILEIMPNRDNAGRHVWFSDNRVLAFKHWKNYTRSIWYIVMTHFEDESHQINGVADISYNVGQVGTPSETLQLVRKGIPILADLPIRFVSIHFCYDDKTLTPLMALCQMIAGTKIRLRFRSHYGSHLECHYSLMTFGIQIPEDVIVLKDRELKRQRMEKYIELNRKLEGTKQEEEQRSLPKGVVALIPSPDDVLLGRGFPYQSFAGNKKMTDLLGQYRVQYQSATKNNEKTAIAMEIVHRIRGYGGRFLRRTDAGWVLVGDIAAREKVSHTMRSAIRSFAADESSGDNKKMPPKGDQATVRDQKRPRLSDDSNDESD